MGTTSERYKELDGAFQKAAAAGDHEAAQTFANDMKLEAKVDDATLVDKNFKVLRQTGEGALGRLANVGRSVIDLASETPMAIAKAAMPGVAHVADAYMKSKGWDKRPWDEYMQESGKIANKLEAESGVPGMIGGGAVDLAATGGVGGLLRRSMPAWLARQSPKYTAPLIATVEGVGAGAYLSPDDRTMGAASGGVGSLVGQQTIGRALGRFANPTRTGLNYHPSQVLMDEGVPLSVGQGANPNTIGGQVMRQIEETLATNPVGGQLIKAQRENANRAFRDIPLEAAAERAGIPVPTRAGGMTARQMANETRAEAGAAIERELVGRTQRMTGVLQRNVDRILDNPTGPMTPTDRASVRGLVEQELFERFTDPVRRTPNVAQLDQVFRAQSTLRKRAFKLMNADDLSKQAQGHALVQVADEILDFIGRRHPAARPRIERVREAYPDIMTVRAATRRAGAAGEFNPEQLAKSAERGHNTDLETWAEMAAPLLTKDPGRLSNYARLLMLSGGIGGLGWATEDPWTTGLALGIPTLALGTRGGQRFLTGQQGWQRALADRVARGTAGDLGAALGRETGLELGD